MFTRQHTSFEPRNLRAGHGVSAQSGDRCHIDGCVGRPERSTGSGYCKRSGQGRGNCADDPALHGLPQTLLDLRDRLMILRFEDAKADLGAVIDVFNRRFGTTFGQFEHSPEAAAENFERSRKRGKVHLSPSASRDEIKQTLSAHYAVLTNVSNRQLAARVYAGCLAEATRGGGERVG